MVSKLCRSSVESHFSIKNPFTCKSDNNSHRGIATLVFFWFSLYSWIKNKPSSIFISIQVFVCLISGFYRFIIYACYFCYYIIWYVSFMYNCFDHVIYNSNYVLLILSKFGEWGPSLPTGLGRNIRRKIVIILYFGFSFQLYVSLFWHKSEEKTKVLADNARVWGRNRVVETRHQS